jgi:hypothetical protein
MGQTVMAVAWRGGGSLMADRKQEDGSTRNRAARTKVSLSRHAVAQPPPTAMAVTVNVAPSGSGTGRMETLKPLHSNDVRHHDPRAPAAGPGKGTTEVKHGEAASLPPDSHPKEAAFSPASSPGAAAKRGHGRLRVPRASSPTHARGFRVGEMSMPGLFQGAGGK